MVDNVICNVCGGRDFVKEAGFYYCTECQTQTCELREQEYELEQTLVGTRTSRATVSRSSEVAATSSSSKKKESSLASWEVFNYILVGLAGELIDHGCDNEFREVLRLLWFKYLHKLGIVSKTKHVRPLLGLAGRRRDATIVYSVRRSNRRRTMSHATSSVSGGDERALRKERMKRKRALVQSEYERNKSTTGSGTRSLADITLSEVSSGGESDNSEKEPKYNRWTRNVLKTEGCVHAKVSASSKYADGVWALRRDKLYALLCLATQLINQPWLPGDILRACRDGRLSYLDYSHFLPLEIPGVEYPATRGSRGPPTKHHCLRKKIYQLAKFLNINLTLYTPDITTTIKKYCLELNLPQEISNMAVNLYHDTEPKFPIVSYMRTTPNYEGRAMAFILFTLKVMFGLDGCTEFELSNFAENINDRFDENMFVFMKWMRYNEYKKTVLSYIYFPSSYVQEHNEPDLKLFANFLRHQKNEDITDNKNLEKEVVNKLLMDLEIYENVPYMNNIDIHKSNFEELNINGQTVRKEDFSTCKLNYLFEYKTYLKKLYDDNYSIVRNSACKSSIYTDLDGNIKDVNFEQWKQIFEYNKLEYLYIDTAEKLLLRKRLKSNPEEPETSTLQTISINSVLTNNNNKGKMARDSITGRFCKLGTDIQNIENEEKKQNKKKKNYHRGKYFISSWQENPALQSPEFLAKSTLKTNKLTKQVKRKLSHGKQSNKDVIYHVSHNEHWVSYMRNPKLGLSKAPPTLRVLIAHCAQFAEQSSVQIYRELQLVDVYVNYIHHALPCSSPYIKEVLPLVQSQW